MTAPVWFTAQSAYRCGCGCDIDPTDLCAWLPDGDDGAVVCWDCAESAEQAAVPA